MNRTLSGRRKSTGNGRNRFSISTLRGNQQPTLSKKLNRVIKNENAAISAHENAGRQRVSIAAQFSEWGESTEDDAVSDISDKLGVLMAEMGEQEDNYAQNLDEYRTILKHIRDTESSVHPTRNQRAKISDEIQKLKWKEPNSAKIDTLEQELVRAEAQNLVAEAQLSNVTRQRLKEAFDIHSAAVIERAEKQILLARHSRRLLNILDDTPVVPGDTRKEYEHAHEAKQIMEDAENDIRSWESTVEPIESAAQAVPATTLLPAPAIRRIQETREDREAREAQEAQEAQETPATLTSEPQAAESGEGYEEEELTVAQAQAEEARFAQAPQMAQPHAAVHTLEAPMMEPEMLEEQEESAAAGARETVTDGVAISEPAQETNGPVSGTEFAARKTGTDPTERSHPVGLGSQARAFAIPV